MAQKEAMPVRSKSFKITENKEEKMARDIIRVFLQSSKESEKGPPKEVDPRNDVTSFTEESFHLPSEATSTPEHTKPNKLDFNASRLSPILQSPAVEEKTSTYEEGPVTAGKERTQEFDRSSVLRHSAFPVLERRSADEDVVETPDQRMRSNSTVQSSSVPPDQMDQIPVLIAERLRYIADHKIEATLAREGILAGVRELIPDRTNEQIQAEFRQHLMLLLPMGNHDTIESTVSTWVKALVMAQTLLQGMAFQDQHSMEDLRNRLEDAVFELFRSRQMLRLVNMCLSNLRRVFSSFSTILQSLSPQLSMIRKKSTSSNHSDSPLERSFTSPAVEESGFFEQSTEYSSNTFTTGTPSTPRRRTSSFSDILEACTTLTNTAYGVPNGYKASED